MISKALPQEKKTIYGIWKQIFAGDDGGYTDYFFRTLYRSENTLVLKQAGNIVSTLMRIPHEIMLNGKMIRASMILGVATVPSHRKQGLMHELMHDVLDELENMLVQKQHAADYDVSISEEEQSKIKEAAQAFMDANTEETIQSLAVSQSDVESLLELYTYQTKMYDPMVADVDTNVDDSEAAQSRITYCRIDISDTQNDDGTTTPLTDEEKQAKKDQAQAILDQLQASADPASADMDAIAQGVSEDLSAVDNTFGDDDTLLDDKLKEAARTLQDGQVYGEVVEGENAYFVVRMDSVLDREATDQQKESIVSDRQQEAYNDLLSQWKDETDITVNDKEWEKVTLTDTEQFTIKQAETEESAEDSTDSTADTAESTEEDTESAEDTAGDTAEGSADSTEAQE